mmetsp:Transcript_6947/g.20431  ORF Transcript_6947/g.20431 Transcript_6947/m.20431 type:complete len:217 (-) Transcript_6947:316-966(-)
MALLARRLLRAVSTRERRRAPRGAAARRAAGSPGRGLCGPALRPAVAAAHGAEGHLRVRVPGRAGLRRRDLGVALARRRRRDHELEPKDRRIGRRGVAALRRRVRGARRLPRPPGAQRPARVPASRGTVGGGGRRVPRRRVARATLLLRARARGEAGVGGDWPGEALAVHRTRRRELAEPLPRAVRASSRRHFDRGGRGPASVAGDGRQRGLGYAV